MYNEGEKLVRGLSNDGVPIGMVFQVTDVRNPLGSVRRMCEAGNRVIFDDDEPGGGCVLNKLTGAKTPMNKENGLYYLYMWVPKSGFQRPE